MLIWSCSVLTFNGLKYFIVIRCLSVFTDAMQHNCMYDHMLTTTGVRNHRPNLSLDGQRRDNGC